MPSPVVAASRQPGSWFPGPRVALQPQLDLKPPLAPILFPGLVRTAEQPVETLEQSVVDALYQQGIENVRIERVLSPPWTTDWISAEGREKLRNYGIAPPAEGGTKRELLHGARSIACPRCASTDTVVVSEFGSTACKASYKCNECLEPFEYFKCL